MDYGKALKQRLIADGINPVTMDTLLKKIDGVIFGPYAMQAILNERW